MRGAPQPGFSRLMRRMSATIPVISPDVRACHVGLSRSRQSKSLPMPGYDRFGLDDEEGRELIGPYLR